MAGIPRADNAGLPAGLPGLKEAMYTICSQFAICSFWGSGYWPVSTP